MQKIYEKEKNSLSSTLLMATLTVTAILALTVVVFSLEKAAPGVHEAFHDFRHSLGFICH